MTFLFKYVRCIIEKANKKMCENEKKIEHFSKAVCELKMKIDKCNS